jgi:hypothetical protein
VGFVCAARRIDLHSSTFERLNASLDGIVIGLNRLRLALESGNTLMVRDERVGQDLDRDSAPDLLSRARYTWPMPPSPSSMRIS